MKLSDVTQHQGVRWGLLAALVLGATKFGDGLDFIYRKWNADVMAGEAQKVAEGVRSDFDRYIETEEQAQKLEQQRLEMQQQFNKQLLEIQQQQQPQYQNLPNPPPHVEGLREWDDTAQTFWCCPWTDREACYNAQAWERCE